MVQSKVKSFSQGLNGLVKRQMVQPKVKWSGLHKLHNICELLAHSTLFIQWKQHFRSLNSSPEFTFEVNLNVSVIYLSSFSKLQRCIILYIYFVACVWLNHFCSRSVDFERTTESISFPLDLAYSRSFSLVCSASPLNIISGALSSSSSRHGALHRLHFRLRLYPRTTLLHALLLSILDQTRKRFHGKRQGHLHNELIL